jgi:hypothetical protein
MIELLVAGFVLVVCTVGVIGMIGTSIASNNRSKHDSIKTMLAEAVIEQMNATLIGSGTADLADCAGTTFTIDAAAGGSKLQGSGTHPNDTLGADIDFNESSPPANYHMDYVVTSPCNSAGQYVATYDVRWHVDQVGAGAGTPSNSFLVTVAAKSKGAVTTGSMSGLYFSLPVNLRAVIGRAE